MDNTVRLQLFWVLFVKWSSDGEWLLSYVFIELIMQHSAHLKSFFFFLPSRQVQITKRLGPFSPVVQSFFPKRL